jgi:hypothetical protein
VQAHSISPSCSSSQLSKVLPGFGKNVSPSGNSIDPAAALDPRAGRCRVRSRHRHRTPGKIYRNKVRAVYEPAEVAAIETALATLLATIDEQNTGLATMDKQGASSPLKALIADPLGQSCSLGIRQLGERLYELDRGRTELMSAVKDRVCKNNDEWAEIIDKRWQGIGG